MKSERELRQDLEAIAWTMARYGAFTQDCKNMALGLAQLWGLQDAWGNLEVRLPTVQHCDVVRRQIGETIQSENGRQRQ